jgi:hypothetical protein
MEAGALSWRKNTLWRQSIYRTLRGNSNMPLALSDEQIDTLTRIASPLSPGDRQAFLEDVAEQLKGREIGSGILHRIAVECQRRYWTPPAIDVRPGKHAR